MSKSFQQLIMERKENTERNVMEILDRLNRWRLMSSNKMVSLDEVAWFGALLTKAGLEQHVDASKRQEGNVVSVVAGDGLRAKDSTIGGKQ